MVGQILHSLLVRRVSLAKALIPWLGLIGPIDLELWLNSPKHTELEFALILSVDPLALACSIQWFLRSQHGSFRTQLDRQRLGYR
jgi:hypothetical protein